MVEQFSAKLPNAMTLQELVDGGLSFEDAQQKMRERVFGEGVKLDAKGNPIERGAGSPEHEAALKAKGAVSTPHQKALEKENERKLAVGGHGNADVISAAVAAGVKAGLQAGKEQAEAEAL